MKIRAHILYICAVLALTVFSIHSQPPEFTYQGKLSSGGVPASGNHDFEFLLFDALSGGTQLGSTLTINNVEVIDGSFTVTLNFGAQFPGANRFLEIRVRPSGGGAFTPLAPRQQINSTPYSIKSLSADTAVNATSAATAANATNAATATNALQLGGVAANQYVLTGDARLSDARNPLPGSASYIQNQNAGPQSSSNFNISGTGTANILTATQYNIGADRVLSNAGTQNLFVGVGAGSVNTGTQNSLFGWNAGLNNTTGSRNSFFGRGVGVNNTTGGTNAFFGASAGQNNTTGGGNAFFGTDAGAGNTTAGNNSFFGQSAGSANTTGFRNAFFGSFAGQNNTIGIQNAFFGTFAGQSNTTGNNNTLVGHFADVGAGNLTNAAAVGYLSFVTQSNSLVLGSINGVNSASADTNVGIGTTAPVSRLHVAANGGRILIGDPGCDPGFAGIGFAAALSGCSNYSLTGNGTNTILSRPVGGNIQFREGNADQMIITPGGSVGIGTISPFRKFHVNGNALIVGDLSVSGTLEATLPAGSSSYIQNQNAAAQALSNFHISGTGTANIFSVATQFNIGNDRILSNPGTGNLFAGVGAGSMNTGSTNSFFGAFAGNKNTTGTANAFFGTEAGSFNSTGVFNTFIGNQAAPFNTTGSNNVFVGKSSGFDNTTGGKNTFIGAGAGTSNTTGIGNTVVGWMANVGANNLTNSAAFGNHAFVSQNNSLVLGSINGVNGATADTSVGIGATAPRTRLDVRGNIHIGDIPGATFSQASNSIYLSNDGGDQNNTFRLDAADNNLYMSARSSAGSAAGAGLIFRTGTTGAGELDRVTITPGGSVGIGTGAPNGRFHIADNNGNIVFGGGGCNSGFTAIGFAAALNCTNYSMLGNGTDTVINAPSTGTISFRIGNSAKASIDTGGVLSLSNLGSAGATAICRNASNQIATCSSSIRYKSEIQAFRSGLDLIKRLRPVAFNWKDGGMHDMGLVAEDVAKVEPLLVTHNTVGEVEGVKYDRVGVVLVNAVKEQQEQIEAQKHEISALKTTIEKQQDQIELLKKAICEVNKAAALCKRDR